MEYVIGFAVGLVVGYLLAKLLESATITVGTKSWSDPVEFTVTGGTLDIKDGHTARFTPQGYPVQANYEIVSTSTNQANFKAKGGECAISLQGDSMVVAVAETETSSGTTVSYISLKLIYGKLYYLGMVAPPVGLKRRFLVRVKGKAIGARGTTYDLSCQETSPLFSLNVYEPFADVMDAAPGSPCITVGANCTFNGSEDVSADPSAITPLNPLGPQ